MRSKSDVVGTRRSLAHFLESIKGSGRVSVAAGARRLDGVTGLEQAPPAAVIDAAG
jgi:hypothetical protein